jgi:hypothetical protein
VWGQKALRTTEAIKVCFGLPIYQAINLAACVKAEQGFAAKVGVVLALLPIIVFTNVCWLTVWAMVFWLVFRPRLIILRDARSAG